MKSFVFILLLVAPHMGAGAMPQILRNGSADRRVLFAVAHEYVLCALRNHEIRLVPAVQIQSRKKRRGFSGAVQFNIVLQREISFGVIRWDRRTELSSMRHHISDGPPLS